MAEATGLFGSGVGSKVSQRAKPVRTLPAGIMKLAVPHIAAPPHVSIPHSDHLTQSEMSPKGPDTNWGSTGSGFQGGGSNSPLGDILGGVEGFIGHLGSDVIHTALGMPAGFVYMLEHPIAGTEMAAKATWHDWSPLFHGDVRLWLHNTWEHPLAPILDVASVLTGGAALSARAAGVAGAVGEAAAEASAVGETLSAGNAAAIAAKAAVRSSALVKTSTGVARSVKAIGTGRTPAAAAAAGSVVEAAGVAGRVAGAASEGMKVSETWQRLQRYSDPSAYAAKQYEKIGEKLGYTGDANSEFIKQAMSHDASARRIYHGPEGTGVRQYREVSNNPWTRVRQSALRDLGNKAAKAAPGLDKVFGDAATFKRLMATDKGVRRAAMVNIIHRQLVGVKEMGQVIATSFGHEWLGRIEPVMREGLISQAHDVLAAGALGSPELQAQLDKLGMEGTGLQAVAHESVYGPKMEAALGKVEKAAGTDKEDAAVRTFLHEDWSKAATANKATDVHIDSQGYLKMVSRPKRIGEEAHGSSQVARMLFENPTRMWKYLILGASPRYFVNNFVGNTLMLMAATNPVGLAQAFHAYMQTGKRMDAAFEEMTARMAARGATAEEIQTLLLQRKIHGRHWMDKWFAGEFGFGESNRLAVHDESHGIIETLNDKYSLHKVTNKYADMPQRYMAMQYTMKRMPEYQRAYAQLRARGATHFYAEQRAAEMAASSPAVRAIVRQQVHHMLGQYHTFNKVEKSVQKLVPFYSWDRAIAQHMLHLVTTQPYKVAMGAAIGSIGTIKLQEIWGQTPDFMQSAIPAKLLSGPLGIIGAIEGKNGTRESSIMAQGLNPYASVADLTKTVSSLLPGGGGVKGIRLGESVGGQINPIIQSAVQELSGVSMHTGAPVATPSLGPIAGIYQGAFGNVPQWNILQALLGMESSTTKKGAPTLYSHQTQAAVSSWLGIPIRQVDVPTANSLAQKLDGKKHRNNTMHSPLL